MSSDGVSKNYFYCLFLTITSDCWALPVFTPQSLPPDRSPIAPRLQPNGSLIAPRSFKSWLILSGWRCRMVFLYMDCWSCTVELLSCLIGWKIEPSFKDRLSWSRSIFNEWTFKNIAHWRSIMLTLQPQATKRSDSFLEFRETSSSTYHLTNEKRSKLPLSFESNLRIWPARSSLWKPSPSVWIKSKTFDDGRTPALPLSISSNTIAAALEKIWIRKFIYIIFHVSHHSLFTYPALRWRGDITSHSPLTCSILILDNVSN